MKVGRRVPGVLAMTVGAALAVLPACGGDDSAEVARELRRQTVGAEMKVELPDGGVTGNTVELTMSGADVEIVEPDGDTSAKTGHYVVFVDKEPVAPGAKIPKDRDIIETWEDTVTIAGLTAGSHDVAVVLSDGLHRRIGTLPAEVNFTVSGPTLRASAPLTVEAKSPVRIAVQVQGVALVAPDGTATDGAGHVDVFVDREPMAAGAKVPTERGVTHSTDGGASITIEDLGGGEHDIWLVLSKGDDTQYDPMVADRITVDVG